jgi:hypothetical protein
MYSVEWQATFRRIVPPPLQSWRWDRSKKLAWSRLKAKTFESTCSSDMSIDPPRTTRHCMLEDRTPHRKGCNKFQGKINFLSGSFNAASSIEATSVQCGMVRWIDVLSLDWSGRSEEQTSAKIVSGPRFEPISTRVQIQNVTYRPTYSELGLKTYWIRSKSLWRWYINTNIVFLNIIHRPVLI